jgi:16S rRNA (guanine527-N7)-methyltransferase
VLAAWRRAQRLGFLGPGPVEEHLRHADVFRAAVPSPDFAIDLGSGGGVPGLALAVWWPESRWVLLDAGDRRTVFLEDAVRELELRDRVEVMRSAAEDAGRRPEMRGRFDLVVARSFGAPAVVGECGAPFLREGGALLVAEPPGSDSSRWPADRLRELSLEDEGRVQHDGGTVRVLRQIRFVSDDIPRRAGVPGRRPRW